MFICKHGMEMREGTGTYYICNLTKSQCKFVRWCNIENLYKPSRNFHACQLKNTETINEKIKDNNHKKNDIVNLDKKVSKELIEEVKIVEQEVKRKTVKTTENVSKKKSSNSNNRVKKNTQNNKKNKEV